MNTVRRFGKFVRVNAMNFAALGIMVAGMFAAGGIALVAFGDSESNTVPDNNRTRIITIHSVNDNASDPNIATTKAIPPCATEDETSDNCFRLSDGDGYSFVVINGEVIYLAGE